MSDLNKHTIVGEKPATIKFLKIRTVKSPTRANEYDAGIDFFVPEFDDSDFLKSLIDKNLDNFSPFINGKGSDDLVKFLHANQSFVILPGKGVMIPSGIKSRMPYPGTALVAANKSGVATKSKLIYGAQVVDYTYKGEIHLHLINVSDVPVKVSAGQKILQFLETPIYTRPVQVISGGMSEERFYEGLQDDRGTGGFGSTGV